jgi:hypothetical protein
MASGGGLLLDAPGVPLRAAACASSSTHLHDAKV